MRHSLWSLSLCSVLAVSAWSSWALADPCPPEECGGAVAEAPQQSCSSDADCYEGMYCVITDDCGANCIGEDCDQDCAPVGYCDWAPEPSEVCFTDADCGDGYICDRAQEAPAPGEDSAGAAEEPTEDPAPMPEPEPGICVEAPQPGGECYSDADCAPGQFCDLDWYQSGDSESREASDAAPGALPDYGLCADQEEEEEECMSEDCSLFNRDGRESSGSSQEGCAVSGVAGSSQPTGALWLLALGALVWVRRRRS